MVKVMVIRKIDLLMFKPGWQDKDFPVNLRLQHRKFDQQSDVKFVGNYGRSGISQCFGGISRLLYFP